MKHLNIAMLRQPMVILYATFCIATAAPFASVTANEDNSLDEMSHIELPISNGDLGEQDNDDDNVDIAESPPEPNFLESTDEDLAPRALRTQNFLRFGRSNGEASRTARTKEDRNTRFNRAEIDDNFIRLGRSANFVRFGRRDAFDGTKKTVATRGANSNFIRLGRTKTEPSNFIRFGRGGSGFIRLGKDGKENDLEDQEQRFSNGTFDRLSRSSKADSNFIRFGRDKLLSSNFMRLGRGGNFLRFGKGDNFLRFGRGSEGNFIRFGRGKNTDALFGRGKLTDRNFIRLGRSIDDDVLSRTADVHGGSKPPVQVSMKHVTLGKGVPEFHNANTKFMRFGRDPELVEENPQSSTHRSKRSLVADYEGDRVDYNNEEDQGAELPVRYYTPSANVPFAPEFAALSSYYTKRATGNGNGNFIRLG